jgi:hypothetical protein
MGRACNTNEERRYAYRVLMGKSDGKRQLGKSRCSWENNIRTNLEDN